jgi:neutral ceramidase
MRQFARAFIVAASGSSAPTDRILFVNTDTAMGDNGVRRHVLQAIAADSTLSRFYNEQNFALIGTHQHSGVGGYLENLLPQVTSLGYVNQTAQAIVDGVMTAARAAHNSLASGTLSTGNTTLMNTNKNRSPTAYLANPASERAQYSDDQDKDFNLINFKGSDGNSRGFLGFFAVHGTSIYENNTLVSSDNKGYAAFLAESAHAASGELPGKTKFVAG